MILSFLDMSVSLITGGYANPVNGGSGTAEIYNPATKTSCLLPKFPKVYFHSQNKGLACGGLQTKTTCAKFNTNFGNWTPSHNLAQERFAHASWDTGNEIYLIGGDGDQSKKTSEKLKEDGSVEEGFSLEYDTM